VNHTSFDLVQRPGFLLWQTSHALSHSLNGALAPFGISILQFGSLVHVTNEPGISAAELSRRSGMTPQSVQSALRPLIDKGVVERRPHPVHGRVLGIYPHESAYDLVREAGIVVDATEAHLTIGFNEADGAQLRDLLLRALTNVNPVALDRSSLRAQ